MFVLKHNKNIDWCLFVNYCEKFENFFFIFMFKKEDDLQWILIIYDSFE